MKTRNALRRTRLLLQTVFASAFALSMVLTGSVWDRTAGALASIQAVPLFLRALAPGGITALSLLAALLVCTAVFGRWYCSLLCPLGAVMDGSSAVRGKKRFKYAPPRRGFQASFFLLTVITAGAGFPLMLDWVDPYGIFARGVRVAFRPLYALVVYLWNLASRAFGFYGPAPVALETDLPVILVSSFIFAAVAAASVIRGRLFCRTLCPAGAVLELASARPLFGIVIDRSCTKCRACEKACPASCIDAGAGKVDSSRCVLCLACLGVCPSVSVSYGFISWNKKVATDSTAAPPDSPPLTVNTAQKKPPEGVFSRRDFLTVAGSAALAFILPSAVKKIAGLSRPSGEVTLSGISRPLAVAPGAVSQTRYARFCTGCGLCVSRCPTGVLRHLNPAIGRLPGSAGGLQPFLDYSRAYCTYDCVVCNQVCPTGALLRLTPEAKRTVAVGISHFKRNRCIVVTNGTPCGACAEHCPTGAVTMKTVEKGKPTEPFLDTSLCVGCGACEKICPALPVKAIWVSGLDPHMTVRLPEGGKTEAGSAEFGF